jgi:phage repressor protein C with HTH and peptisase S24 domain
MNILPRIQEVMEARDSNQSALAHALNIESQSVNQWFRKDNPRPAMGRLPEIAKALRCRPADLLAPVGSPISPLPDKDEEASSPASGEKPARPSVPQAVDPANPLGITPAEEVRYAPGITLPPHGPRDVPVYGTAQCGPEGEFVWDGNSNLAVDIVPRPAALANLRNVFAVYAVGDSMVPWCEPGDTVFVHPDREPRNGDYVLIEFREHVEDEQKKAVIKRLVGHRHGAVIVSQHNPPKEREFPEDLVEHIWRVIGWQEALGTRTR